MKHTLSFVKDEQITEKTPKPEDVKCENTVKQEFDDRYKRINIYQNGKVIGNAIILADLLCENEPRTNKDDEKHGKIPSTEQTFIADIGIDLTTPPLRRVDFRMPNGDLLMTATHSPEELTKMLDDYHARAAKVF